MGSAIRQIHRWLSLAFTFGFALNFTVIVLLGHKTPPPWLYLFAVIPALFAIADGALHVRPAVCLQTGERGGRRLATGSVHDRPPWDLERLRPL